MVTMENKQSKKNSLAKLTSQLWASIILKNIEAMGLKINASRSPGIALRPYQILRKSTKRFRTY
jgi:hypothetical protein